MGTLDFFNFLYFSSFEELVDFISSKVPSLILLVFVINVIFSVLYELFHLGGRD